jgi:hypothetical protein
VWHLQICTFFHCNTIPVHAIPAPPLCAPCPQHGDADNPANFLLVQRPPAGDLAEGRTGSSLQQVGTVAPCDSFGCPAHQSCPVHQSVLLTSLALPINHSCSPVLARPLFAHSSCVCNHSRHSTSCNPASSLGGPSNVVSCHMFAGLYLHAGGRGDP